MKTGVCRLSSYTNATYWVCRMCAVICVVLSDGRFTLGSEAGATGDLWLSKEYRVDGDIRLIVEGRERPLSEEERKRFRNFQDIDRMMLITTKLKVGSRTFETGALGTIPVGKYGAAEIKRLAATPVLDTRLIDGRLYVLEKTSLATSLLRLDSPRATPPGEFQLICHVAVDTRAAGGVTPIDETEPPAAVGPIRSARIMSVKGKSVRVELSTEHGKSYVREYPLTEYGSKVE